MAAVYQHQEHHLSDRVGVQGCYDKHSQEFTLRCASNEHCASYDHVIWSVAPFKAEHKCRPVSCSWP
jgi:hypothetical protein